MRALRARGCMDQLVFAVRHVCEGCGWYRTHGRVGEEAVLTLILA